MENNQGAPGPKRPRPAHNIPTRPGSGRPPALQPRMQAAQPPEGQQTAPPQAPGQAPPQGPRAQPAPPPAQPASAAHRAPPPQPPLPAPAKKPKWSVRKKVLLAVGMLLIYLVSGSLTFFLMSGGLSSLPFFRQKAALPYAVEGPVRALRLNAPESFDKAELRAYFAEAFAFCEENSYNTVIFPAMLNGTSWWRDEYFPPPAEVAEEDGLFSKYDPLDILFEQLGEKPIQIWLEVDPYNASGQYIGAKGKVAKLSGAGSVGSFSPDDGEYTGLLTKSLAALPSVYPVAGLVFTGFEKPTEGSGFVEGFKSLLSGLQSEMAAGGRSVPLGLSFGETSPQISAAYALELQAGGLVNYLLPQIATGANLAERIAQFSQGGMGLIAVQPQDDDGLFLFELRNNPALAGVLMGSWPALAEMGDEVAYWEASLQTPDSVLPEGFELPQLLGITYPEQNAKVTSESLFITGTSGPGTPLTLDGAEVPLRSVAGLFGVAVNLTMGVNSFTFTQGADSLTLNVERVEPSASGGGSIDNSTSEAQKGQVVRVTSTIASALITPTDMSAINETLPAGATFVVEESTRLGSGIWAYKMKSGDYVLANNCQWLDGDGKSHFTGLSAQPATGGEYIQFEGAGAPAAYVAYGDEDGVLTLTFYDTTFELPEGFSSTHVSSASVAVEGDTTVLRLQTQNLWGYNLEYDGDTTRLYLKTPPKRGENPAKPLEGVRIMLDPGHGDNDIGSPGVLWNQGPHEKQLNLALAQTIAYRLRQLGAEVLLTREDDTFLELWERLELQNFERPDFFISVHHNALDPVRDLNDAKGVEVYYYHPYSVPASQAFATNLLGPVARATGRTERKVDYSYFYVTRTTVCPSVLFEYGFAMNPAEFEDIASADGMLAAAFGTADGILATLPG